MLEVYDDAYFMRQALKQAELAGTAGEIPVGAVVVADNRIIARGYNETERLNDVTAHAEIIALTAAANHLGDKYLRGCTLYVTLEPCPMCAGALHWAQTSRIVYGASDDKRGFMRFGRELLHPKTKLEFGVLHEDCARLMQQFFRQRR
ncbi:tRNA-specific adenosine deaminase [Neolewinella maritima]|uniref:tRNA-specific adenosine deaminase n=1 Tax=Neolewinella maritima TaxID=1383882 RepID=A0ABN8F4S2_9BACT|nr:nucleoside deaminase [Neolewinella maritima]CAH0999766.1 tRNA-specific adenosine deaminase [Neolewinella maritima]